MRKQMSEEKIAELNKRVRPLLKKGILHRLYNITFMDPDCDYQTQRPVSLAKDITKLREKSIKLPTRGYSGYTFNLTPRIVLNQLDNSDLKGATNYYVEPKMPHDPVLVLPEFIEAKVEIYGAKGAANLSNKNERTK